MVEIMELADGNLRVVGGSAGLIIGGIAFVLVVAIVILLIYYYTRRLPAAFPAQIPANISLYTTNGASVKPVNPAQIATLAQAPQATIAQVAAISGPETPKPPPTAFATIYVCENEKLSRGNIKCPSGSNLNVSSVKAVYGRSDASKCRSNLSGPVVDTTAATVDISAEVQKALADNQEITLGNNVKGDPSVNVLKFTKIDGQCVY